MVRVTMVRVTMARVTIVAELTLLRLTIANRLMRILMLIRVQAQVGPAMRRAPGVATTVSFLTPMIATLTMGTGSGRPPSRNGRRHDGRRHWSASALRSGLERLDPPEQLKGASIEMPLSSPYRPGSLRHV